MEKISMTDIRRKNYSDVYHLIYQKRRISKSKIASTLQMSLPTVTQHLAALTEDGLVEVQGQMASGIGRKAAAYGIKTSAWFAAGVEVLPERAVVVIMDLYGRAAAKKERSLVFSQDESYFAELARLIQETREEARIEEDAVLGVGVGMMGLVSEDGQMMRYGKILDCTGLTVEPLEKQLPWPVWFVHDAECAAALELWWNPELTDAIYLSLGVHLGCAIIAQGQIQRGRTGRTGTVEHMTLVNGGRDCYCGKQGCMDCYCSASALLEPGEQLPDFFSRLRQGNARYAARWMEYLNYLALALNNLHMVIDSAIVLGGHIAPYLSREDVDLLFSKIQSRTAFPEEENFLLIGVQENHAVALGAAIPVIRAFLAAI